MRLLEWWYLGFSCFFPSHRFRIAHRHGRFRSAVYQSSISTTRVSSSRLHCLTERGCSFTPTTEREMALDAKDIWCDIAGPPRELNFRPSFFESFCSRYLLSSLWPSSTLPWVAPSFLPSSSFAPLPFGMRISLYGATGLRVLVFVNFAYRLTLKCPRAPGPSGDRGRWPWRSPRWCAPRWRRHSLRRHKAGPGAQLLTWVSFKPERAFKVIAHFGDWEHAETVRRRCLRTVGGLALHAECTGPGGHVGESSPGPTGLTWAFERSAPGHAQAERPLTERSGARACSLTSSDLWAPTQELAFGRYLLRRGWTRVREIRRWYWSDQKYDEPRQVERRDPLNSGLVPPVSEETDHPRSGRSDRVEQTRFCGE